MIPYRLHLAVMCIAFTSACAGQSGSSMRELELSYLRAALAPELLDMAHIETPALENIKVITAAGKLSLALRNYYGQPLKNGGVRAEVTVDYPFRPGDVVTYSWRFMLPTTTVSDAPRNRWWLVGSWHDQPDVTKGETWNGFPPRSPPIAIGYGVLNGKDTLSIVYGSPNPVTVGLIPFTRGEWHRIEVRVTWSRGGDGSVAVFLDDSATPLVAARGRNMHNDFQHYLKVGSYRHPEIQGDAWIFVTDIGIRRGS